MCMPKHKETVVAETVVWNLEEKLLSFWGSLA